MPDPIFASWFDASSAGGAPPATPAPPAAPPAPGPGPTPPRARRERKRCGWRYPATVVLLIVLGLAVWGMKILIDLQVAQVHRGGVAANGSPYALYAFLPGLLIVFVMISLTTSYVHQVHNAFVRLWIPWIVGAGSAVMIVIIISHYAGFASPASTVGF